MYDWFAQANLTAFLVSQKGAAGAIANMHELIDKGPSPVTRHPSHVTRHTSHV